MTVGAAPRPAAPPGTLAVSLGQHSEAGRQPLNQDFHGACLPAAAARAAKGVVVALADGIGSSPVGHVASQAAVRAVLDDYYATSETWSVGRSMQRVLAATNAWLHAQTQRGPHRHDHDRGHVCTISVLVVKGTTAHVFHVGDARVWRLQGRQLEPLTVDHRVDVGGGRSYLSRALGFHPQVEIDYRRVAVEPGDVFVLACDGVHEHVGSAAIAETVARCGDDLGAAARELAAQALRHGSDDNLTVQILRIDALPPADAGAARQARAGLRPPPLLRPGDTLDGWRIERELHASHRSHVYLATDLDRGGTVVLKAPSIELQDDEAHLDRLATEEWIARRIDHPHVLRAAAPGRPRSRLYAVMEHVEGRTLAQWLRDHPQPDLETVRGLVEQIARGLQALHRLEMLHQDLRPENVLVDARGTAKIIDFGAVRVAGLAERGPAAMPAEAPGTLAYMAPEYFIGEAASERSDLYSLGVITYQMLTGRLPYGTRVAGLRDRAGLATLVYASALDDARRIPPWIDRVLAKAVHPLPARRHEAVSEFVHELRHPPPAALRPLPWAERDPLRFWKTLAALLALAVVVLGGLLAGRR